MAKKEEKNSKSGLSESSDQNQTTTPPADELQDFADFNNERMETTKVPKATTEPVGLEEGAEEPSNILPYDVNAVEPEAEVEVVEEPPKPTWIKRAFDDLVPIFNFLGAHSKQLGRGFVLAVLVFVTTYVLDETLGHCFLFAFIAFFAGCGWSFFGDFFRDLKPAWDAFWKKFEGIGLRFWRAFCVIVACGAVGFLVWLALGSFWKFHVLINYGAGLLGFLLFLPVIQFVFDYYDLLMTEAAIARVQTRRDNARKKALQLEEDEEESRRKRREHERRMESDSDYARKVRGERLQWLQWAVTGLIALVCAVACWRELSGDVAMSVIGALVGFLFGGVFGRATANFVFGWIFSASSEKIKVRDLLIFLGATLAGILTVWNKDVATWLWGNDSSMDVLWKGMPLAGHFLIGAVTFSTLGWFVWWVAMVKIPSFFKKAPMEEEDMSPRKRIPWYRTYTVAAIATRIIGALVVYQGLMVGGLGDTEEERMFTGGVSILILVFVLIFEVIMAKQILSGQALGWRSYLAVIITLGFLSFAVVNTLSMLNYEFAQGSAVNKLSKRIGSQADLFSGKVERKVRSEVQMGAQTRLWGQTIEDQLRSFNEGVRELKACDSFDCIEKNYNILVQEGTSMRSLAANEFAGISDPVVPRPYQLLGKNMADLVRGKLWADPVLGSLLLAIFFCFFLDVIPTASLFVFYLLDPGNMKEHWREEQRKKALQKQLEMEEEERLMRERARQKAQQNAPLNLKREKTEFKLD